MTNRHTLGRRLVVFAAASFAFLTWLAPAGAQHSVAREWNELLLESISNDNARPTVHARNLYHVSLAMWDAWATYDYAATPILFNEDHADVGPDVKAKQEEAMSYAVLRVLKGRFGASPGAATMMPLYDAYMTSLGYNPDSRVTIGSSPAAVGNRIGITVLAFGFNDGANEAGNYANLYYEPVNPPLIMKLPGNPDIVDPDRWQPLALDFTVDQSGNPIPGGFVTALSPEWGQVVPFALQPEEATIYHRDGFDYWVYHDPGPPPHFPSKFYKDTFELVAVWSSHLDPSDGVMIDISPASIGNVPLPAWPSEHNDFYDYPGGGDWGEGWDLNPVTGLPYEPQIVPRGDYTRVLAEFWADGPTSETPPGHWFTILHHVMDHPLFERRLEGQGPIVDDLEYDVKAFLTLGGAMHDTAITAWGIKGWYDFIRPVSALRLLADIGQSSDPLAPSFHPDGIHLRPGFIELVTAEHTAPGGKMEHLAGEEGKIAFYAWRGPDYIVDPETDVAGVGWILAEEWWPYQRPTFVTPPFAGYISGHSTFSRTAANVLELLTGSPYFPGGLGEFPCPQNEFLVFEDGPSVDMTLQWAAYADASDQTSLSRIWGGIHPSVDDIPGRIIGEILGPEAFDHARDLWGPQSLWEDKGNGLDTFIPAPVLYGAGSLANGQTIALELVDTWPLSVAYLIVGASQIDMPFKGGVLVPSADVVFSFPTGGGETLGHVLLEDDVPFRVPSGSSFYFQFWTADPTGPAGFSASNALELTAP